jgi:hypothetical protein
VITLVLIEIGNDTRGLPLQESFSVPRHVEGIARAGASGIALALVFCEVPLSVCFMSQRLRYPGLDAKIGSGFPVEMKGTGRGDESAWSCSPSFTSSFSFFIALGTGFLLLEFREWPNEPLGDSGMHAPRRAGVRRDSSAPSRAIEDSKKKKKHFL